MNKHEACGTCRGEGEIRPLDSTGRRWNCPTCHGMGIVNITPREDPNLERRALLIAEQVASDLRGRLRNVPSIILVESLKKLLIGFAQDHAAIITRK